MEIVRTIEQLGRPAAGTVATLGNFDGVHLGHREIFRRVVAEARLRGGTAAVVTFVPHPLKLLAPERAPALINTYVEKERLIEASCIDLLLCLPFTRELASWPPEKFVREILVERLAIAFLVVGHDYAFGSNRTGDARFLQVQGEQHGFGVEVLGPISGPAGVYSSSRIRRMITAGEVASVVNLLGRHFTLEGRVVQGAGRGAGLGFPTANLETEKELRPAAGVYAVKVRLGERQLDGVANIGCNPTFGGGNPGIEIHLLDFSGDLYGATLRVYFVARLRGESRFESPDLLQRAIAGDIAAARPLLRKARVVEYREYLDCGHLPHGDGGRS